MVEKGRLSNRPESHEEDTEDERASVAFKIEKFENQLNNMATEVQDVKHNTQQLKPNGGHSLADKINNGLYFLRVLGIQCTREELHTFLREKNYTPNSYNVYHAHLTQFHQISDLSQCPSEGDK